jgi:hypothetical protein
VLLAFVRVGLVEVAITSTLSSGQYNAYSRGILSHVSGRHSSNSQYTHGLRNSVVALVM